MSEKHSFWSTFPGILTGIAAIITAVGGLLIVLSQIGLLDDNGTVIERKPNTAEVDDNSSPAASTEDIKVYSEGSAVIRGTWSWNLDLGVQQLDGADLWWEQVTSTERYIVPKNGAQFHVIGIRDFNSISFRDLAKLTYSSKKINGSDATYNQIPKGTVVTAITSERRYSKFRIDDYGYNLKISWVTYEKP